MEEEIKSETREEKSEILEEKKEVKDETPWLFFDYSGTLVDTLAALSKTYTKFMGKEFTLATVRSLYRDYSTHKNKFYVIRKYKLNPFKLMFKGKKKFDEIRKEEFWLGVRTFPGISEVLFRLRKIINAKFGMVTYETELEEEEERKKIFQHFGIPIEFDAFIIDSRKKEEKFDTFIAENDIKYGIIVGDNQSDLDMGKKYNFNTIGVTWGFSSRDDFTADYIIDDPREMIQAIMNLLHQIEQQKLQI